MTPDRPSALAHAALWPALTASLFALSCAEVDDDQRTTFFGDGGHQGESRPDASRRGPLDRLDSTTPGRADASRADVRDWALPDAAPDDAPVCGDGRCEALFESCSTCPQDCGACPPVCGDAVCEAPTETCGSCPQDCGACPLVCGDGVCDAPEESCDSCPQDCGACPAVCGDSRCEAPDETCDTCPQDCGACGWPADLARSEEVMLDLVNELRAQGATCGGQRMGAVGPLRMDAALREAARLHSQDMGQNNYFDHRGRDGSSFGDRARRAGYTAFPAGENIAAGNASAQATFQQWVNSPGHCANMMRGQFNEIGVGHANVRGTRYGDYWTQVFGTR